MDLLKGKFLTNQSEMIVTANEVFQDCNYIGLYFSASWCPPCETFLPLLKQIYEKARAQEIGLEIIYVSADTDNQQMMRGFIDNHGSWYALPVGPLSMAIRAKMQVFIIPYLIILNAKGQIVTRQGREDVEKYEDPFAVWFPELKSK